MTRATDSDLDATGVRPPVPEAGVVSETSADRAPAASGLTLAVASSLLLATIVGGMAFWHQSPATAEQLYEERCSVCHALPDLSYYGPEDIAPLVDFMRAELDAAALISDEEAAIIKAYLQSIAAAEAQVADGLARRQPDA